MNIFFSILSRFLTLKGINEMPEGNAITEIKNEDYLEFFATHEIVYKDNYYRQGLFLLGIIINRIIYVQKGKHGEGSSTFIDKINLNGVSPIRLLSLVSEVRRYEEIYRKDDKYFMEPELWGQITDRLQGIENSKMSNDETVFYILSGISYGRYLGYMNSQKKNLK
jgi:CRISPR-associated protein Csh1